MAQGTPFRCLPWPTPPAPHFKVLGGGKGEVKPPKCPTRHPKVGGYICIYLYIHRFRWLDYAPRALAAVVGSPVLFWKTLVLCQNTADEYSIDKRV